GAWRRRGVLWPRKHPCHVSLTEPGSDLYCSYISSTSHEFAPNADPGDSVAVIDGERTCRRHRLSRLVAARRLFVCRADVASVTSGPLDFRSRDLYIQP